MRTLLLIAAALSLTASGKAQDKPDTAVYKVEFNIRDGGDAAAKTARRYTLLVRNNQKSTFRVGDKIPYATGSGNQSTQFSYLDTGVNIDCIARELNEKIALFAEVDLSTAASRPATGIHNPTVAQAKMVINTVLAQGQPSLVASFDDPVTSRRLDVEATVSKVN